MTPPTFLGLIGGVAMLAASLTPSLVPRHWAFQGIVSGIVTAAGYAAGTLVSHLWRRAGLGEEPPPRVKVLAWRGLAVLAPLTGVIMLVLGIGWQRQMHELMGMPIPSAWGYIGAVVLGLALAVAILALARGIRWAARRVAHILRRWLPRPHATVLGGLLVALLGIGLLQGVVAEELLSAADRTFQLSDGLLDGTPTAVRSDVRSGGPGSLVEWEDLGAQGRQFVTAGPTTEDLSEFTAGPITPPIRVYAGLASREDVADRAALVVEELVRTGAFDRAVLCVMTPTGTGRINPQAAAALEYLWGGDTALATMQYSYLPSPLSFLVDSNRARESGAELFNAVHAHWEQLPAAGRPKLVVFGESLGVYGSEAAFSGLADLRNRTDGALWVGPPNFSEMWTDLTVRRDPDSPEHRPTYDGGATVRLAGRPEDLAHPDHPWPTPRVVYLQHPSDPVVWWTPRMILSQPDWLDEPLGHDVLPVIRWFPLVTFLQVTADMANAERVPAGHAHEYGSLVADAWAAIVPPPGWNADDGDRLRLAVEPEPVNPHG